MTKEEKIEEIRREENLKTETPETKKQKRLERAENRKKNWKVWREDQDHVSDDEAETPETDTEKENVWEGEDETEEKEIELTKTLEKVETEGMINLIGLETSGKLCLMCIYNPCICILTKLEMKINMLRETDGNREKPEVGGLLGGRRPPKSLSINNWTKVMRLEDSWGGQGRTRAFQRWE